jgi:pilus assembly protein CpaB
MNITRVIVLCVAAIAAGAAALLVRGMLGGGTPDVQASLPPPAVTAEVLVASKEIAPGRVLDVDSVRWDAWPKGSVSDAFITKEAQPDMSKAVAGIVVRAPLVSGQPITDASIVRAGSAGFLAATLAPGMRAVSMAVSAETGAGGFVLPNDRVDVILTRDVTGGSGQIKIYRSQTILHDVRVLAVDQTAQQPKDQQAEVVKTATLELTPAQSELIEVSRAAGTLSLALRALGDSSDDTLQREAEAYRDRLKGDEVKVIRYGVCRCSATGDQGGRVQ